MRKGFFSENSDSYESLVKGTLMYLSVFVLSALFLLTIVLLVHMQVSCPRGKDSYSPQETKDPEREELYARRLSAMIRCDTVSDPDVFRAENFERFHRVLEEQFPLVHSHLEKTEKEGNLLFFWKGESDERPLVLMSHQDTVPAEGNWKYGPFDGVIAEGRVWGRGAVDTKCSVMGFFQAVEELLAEGYTPSQDIWLSSSCTEECGGGGCRTLVEELRKRGIKPFLVCDEGGGIMEDPLPGVRGYYAMVGVQEKGAASVIFKARSKGGHGSTPFPHSPLPVLAKFICRIERRNPFRRRMPVPVREMLRSLAPCAVWPARFVFSNLWLFGPFIAKLMPVFSPRAAAMVQTTAAFTMQYGSEAANVIPQEAGVTVNLRFIPHQRMEESLERIRKIGERYDLEMQVLHAEDVSRYSDPESEAGRLLSDVIRRTFPGIVVSPYLLTGGTDARAYEEICDHVFRFSPVVMGAREKAGIHACDESINCECLPGCVDFYKNLIRSCPAGRSICGKGR